MKQKKALWIILIVLLAVAIALAVVLPRISGRGAAPEEAEPETDVGTVDAEEGAENTPDEEGPTPAPSPEATVDPELPLDQSELVPSEDDQNGDIQPGAGDQPGAGEQPAVPSPTDGGEPDDGWNDPGDGTEEDELPIIP